MAKGTDAARAVGATAPVLGRACRHFSGLNFMRGDGDDCKACAIGHPIRKIVISANGGTHHGIAYKTPCRPGPERAAECPNYDPQTDEEIAAERDRMREHMDRFVKALPVLNAIRSTMIDGKIARDVVDCPFCGTAKALHVSVAIGYNNHMRAKCKECGDGFIE